MTLYRLNPPRGKRSRRFFRPTDVRHLVSRTGMDTPLYRRPDKPHLPGYSGERGAGFVLTWLGVLAMGSTCPFAVVLSAEWLRDPRRTDGHRIFDIVSLCIASPGACFWTWFSVGFVRYSASLALVYWPVFALWLIVRVFTRWREIAELRRLDAAVPTVHPPTDDATRSGSEA